MVSMVTHNFDATSLLSVGFVEIHCLVQTITNFVDISKSELGISEETP